MTSVTDDVGIVELTLPGQWDAHAPHLQRLRAGCVKMTHFYFRLA
jgi:hypothetical protein